jgi:hypothetical protein
MWLPLLCGVILRRTWYISLSALSVLPLNYVTGRSIHECYKNWYLIPSRHNTVSGYATEGAVKSYNYVPLRKSWV